MSEKPKKVWSRRFQEDDDDPDSFFVDVVVQKDDNGFPIITIGVNEEDTTEIKTINESPILYVNTNATISISCGGESGENPHMSIDASQDCLEMTFWTGELVMGVDPWPCPSAVLRKKSD